MNNPVDRDELRALASDMEEANEKLVEFYGSQGLNPTWTFDALNLLTVGAQALREIALIQTFKPYTGEEIKKRRQEQRMNQVQAVASIRCAITQRGLFPYVFSRSTLVQIETGSLQAPTWLELDMIDWEYFKTPEKSV